MRFVGTWTILNGQTGILGQPEDQPSAPKTFIPVNAGDTIILAASATLGTTIEQSGTAIE